MLAADTAPVLKRGVSLRLALVAAVALALAFGVLVAWLGMRPDLMDAMHTSAYWMKTLYTLGLALAGFALVERLSRPGVRSRIGSHPAWRLRYGDCGAGRDPAVDAHAARWRQRCSDGLDVEPLPMANSRTVVARG